MGAAIAEPVLENRYAKSRAFAAQVEGILDGGEMSRKRHSDVEDFLDAKGKEWARQMYEEHLAMRAALERKTGVVGADGVARGSTRDSERHVVTLLGRVPVPRLSYQAPGSEDLHPRDGALNLPREMYSHGVRRLVAKEVARASFDEVVEMVHDYTGTSIGKRQVEELAVRAAQGGVRVPTLARTIKVERLGPELVARGGDAPHERGARGEATSFVDGLPSTGPWRWRLGVKRVSGLIPQVVAGDGTG